MSYKNITQTVYKVSDFLSFQKNKSLILSPKFQRRAVWRKPLKSYLIDTIVKGLPIPIIFLREQTDIKNLEPYREVVDGQQRLRTIISFIKPKLLKDYRKEIDEFVVSKSHNKEIGGKSFDDLNDSIKKQILDYGFSVHILPSYTEDREVLQIFARMNSTGLKLNPQELRNAAYFGVFKQLAYNLSYEQYNRFNKWGIYNDIDIARMTEVEDTSDFILFILKGLQGKSQGAINKLYESNEDSFDYEKEITLRYRYVMDKIDETIGDYII